jgi:hypothetical protein
MVNFRFLLLWGKLSLFDYEDLELSILVTLLRPRHSSLPIGFLFYLIPLKVVNVFDQ